MSTSRTMRLICVLAALLLAAFTLCGAAAESASFRVIPVVWQTAVLARCTLPNGFETSFRPFCCDEATDLSYPLKLLIRITSPESGVTMQYFCGSMYTDDSSAGSYMSVQDYMDAGQVCDNIALSLRSDAVLRSEEDLSAVQAELQARTVQYYEENPQGDDALSMYLLNVEATVAHRTYTFEDRGETWCISVITQVEGQFWARDGYCRETYTVWEIPGYYLMYCRLSDYETALENYFMPFVLNTSVNDQFRALNRRLSGEIAPQVIMNGSITCAADTVFLETMETLAFSGADQPSYTEGFTDLLWGSEAYTLSDGTFFRLPASYNNVCENSDGKISFGAPVSDGAVPLIPDP